MLVVWGPELIKIYNDRYREMLGADKHPEALGRPVREVWPEIWDEIGPMFEQVIDTQVPTFDHHGRLVIERNGFPEEAFFTWSYSPLYDDDGSVGGVLDVVVETTDQVDGRTPLLGGHRARAATCCGPRASPTPASPPPEPSPGGRPTSGPPTSTCASAASPRSWPRTGGPRRRRCRRRCSPRCIAGGEVVLLGQASCPTGPPRTRSCPSGGRPTTGPGACWWPRSTRRSRSTTGSACSSTWSPPRSARPSTTRCAATVSSASTGRSTRPCRRR